MSSVLKDEQVGRDTGSSMRSKDLVCRGLEAGEGPTGSKACCKYLVGRWAETRLKELGLHSVVNRFLFFSFIEV